MDEGENAPDPRALAARAWQEGAAAGSYRHRPAYPPQTFDILRGLIGDQDPTVLDLGCGTGFVARPLARFVRHVDAVDISSAMIEEGKRLPGGDNPALHWIVGRAEDVPLHRQYALITAGDSLHWMEWDVVLPRLAGVLSPEGKLAVLSADSTIVPRNDSLQDAIMDLVRRYSTYRREIGGLLDHLLERGLFREEGRTQTEPVRWEQTVDEYVESFHARASLAWGRLTAQDAAAFDASLRDLLHSNVGDTVAQEVRGFIAWGKPLPGGST